MGSSHPRRYAVHLTRACSLIADMFALLCLLLGLFFRRFLLRIDCCLDLILDLVSDRRLVLLAMQSYLFDKVGNLPSRIGIWGKVVFRDVVFE